MSTTNDVVDVPDADGVVAGARREEGYGLADFFQHGCARYFVAVSNEGLFCDGAALRHHPHVRVSTAHDRFRADDLKGSSIAPSRSAERHSHLC